MPLLIFGLCGAGVFLLATALQWPWLALATKGLPVIAMLLWLRRSEASAYRRWITVGLAFSLLGDWLLGWPQDLFVWGLSAFFLAHLAYVRAYCLGARHLAGPWLLLAAVFGITMYGILARGGLGEMAVPVAAYATVISLMLWRALARLNAPQVGRTSAYLAAAGAILFVISDSLIGLDRFVSSFPAAPYAIILTYWLGQWAIAASAASPAEEALQSS